MEGAEGHINFKLGGNFHRGGETRDTLSRSVGRNMVDIQHTQCKNQRKTSSNRQNIVAHKEIKVKESNASVRFFTGSSSIAIC